MGTSAVVQPRGLDNEWIGYRMDRITNGSDNEWIGQYMDQITHGSDNEWIR